MPIPCDCHDTVKRSENAKKYFMSCLGAYHKSYQITHDAQDGEPKGRTCGMKVLEGEKAYLGGIF